MYMGLVVPFNGDLELVELLDSSVVSNVYGRENSRTEGGGRASQSTVVSEEVIRAAIQLCKRKGISFDYVLNMPWMDGKQFSVEGRQELDRKFQWVEEIGADYVIVALPELIDTYKSRRNLNWGISKFVRTRDMPLLRNLVELGADRVCLDLSVTRNFSMLKAMQSMFPDKLQLLANDSCLYACIMEDSHAHSSSRASMGDGRNTYTHSCSYWCLDKFVEDPAEIIKSTFIRPEDLQQYRDLGFDDFKLIDRNRPTPWIQNVVKAYTNERYDGNLADLFSLLSWYGQERAEVDELEQTAAQEIRTVQQVQEIRRRIPAMLAVEIDNRVLDGYLGHFADVDCRLVGCKPRCDYCGELAAKAVYIDPQRKQLVGAILHNVRTALISGISE